VALPYLYGTCDKLGRVTVESSDRKVHFATGRRSEECRDDVAIETTEVNITDSGQTRRFAVVRVSKKEVDSVLLVILNDKITMPISCFPEKDFQACNYLLRTKIPGIKVNAL
jgi:hypothetical protein